MYMYMQGVNQQSLKGMSKLLPDINSLFFTEAITQQLPTLLILLI